MNGINTGKYFDLLPLILCSSDHTNNSLPLKLHFASLRNRCLDRFAKQQLLILEVFQ